MQKWRINALPIGDMLDSQSPFLELQDVITFGKNDVKLEGSVLKDNPPMINVLMRVQDSFRCIPINVD